MVVANALSSLPSSSSSFSVATTSANGLSVFADATNKLLSVRKSHKLCHFY